jgi:hypothetical protein
MNSKTSLIRIFTSKFHILKSIQNASSIENGSFESNLIPKYHFHFVQHPTQKYEIIKKLTSSVEIRKYSATMCHFVRVDKGGIEIRDKDKDKDDDDDKIDVFKRITKNDENNQQLPFYLCRPFPKIFENIFGKEVGDEKIWIKEIPEMIVAASKFSGQTEIDDYLRVRNEILNAIGPVDAKNYDFVNLFTSDNKIDYEVWIRRVKF